MSPLEIVAWVVDAWIIGTLLMARRPQHIAFNFANLVGGLILLVYLASVAAWGSMPLTAAFTAIGGSGRRRRVLSRVPDSPATRDRLLDFPAPASVGVFFALSVRVSKVF